MNIVIEKITSIFLAIFAFIYGIFNPGFTYADVESYSKNAFEMPGLEEDFVPQGVCYVEALGMFAVSGYSSADKSASQEARLSRIYLVDTETNESKKLLLLDVDGSDFTAHAGGIASSGNDVWVSSGGGENSYGSVYHIGADVLASAENGAKVQFDGKFKTEAKGSFLYCSDDMLFVGEFYNEDNLVNKNHYFADNHGIICAYSLPLKENYAPEAVLSIPDEVQGMAINEEGKVLFSASYGRRKDSRIYIFDDYKNWTKSTVGVLNNENAPLYIADNDVLTAKIKMPTLMEGFDYENGKLYAIFESGAEKYSDAKRVIKHAWEIDINAVIESLK